MGFVSWSPSKIFLSSYPSIKPGNGCIDMYLNSTSLSAGAEWRGGGECYNLYCPLRALRSQIHGLRTPIQLPLHGTFMVNCKIDRLFSLWGGQWSSWIGEQAGCSIPRRFWRRARDDQWSLIKQSLTVYRELCFVETHLVPSTQYTHMVSITSQSCFTLLNTKVHSI